MLEKLGAKIAAAAVAVVLSMAAGAWLAAQWYAPRLELAEGKVENLGEQVREQNRAIEALREAEKTRKAEADRRVAAAAEKAREDERAAQVLLSEQRPAGMDACTAASALITKELRK